MNSCYDFTKQRDLFHLANDILTSCNIKKEQWSFGGGTALSLLYYNHRMSFDIDIFIEDAELFHKFHSNRKRIQNDLSLKDKNVLASENSVTFIVETEGPGLKMDFLHFPSVLNNKNNIIDVFELENIHVQTVEEILAKKLKYREIVTVRDYVDFAYIEEKDSIISKLKKEHFLNQDRFIDIVKELSDFDETEFEEEVKFMNPKDIKNKKDIEDKLSKAFGFNDIIRVGCDDEDVVLFDNFIEKERTNYEEIQPIHVFNIYKRDIEKILKITNIKPDQLIGIPRTIIEKIKFFKWGS